MFIVSLYLLLRSKTHFSTNLNLYQLPNLGASTRVLTYPCKDGVELGSQNLLQQNNAGIQECEK